MTFVRMLSSTRTYLRILYLVLAFPLATVYFTVIVTGISVGIGTAIIIIGVPILFVTLLATIAFARLERLLAIHLLGASVPPASILDPTRLPFLQWVRRTLLDPQTWKGFVFVLLEFPFSVFSFTLTITLLSIAFSFALSPFAYAIAALFDPAFPVDAYQNSTFPGPGFVQEPVGLQVLAIVLLGVLGVLLAVGSIALLNGIGTLWGEFARLMLGLDESRVQLAAAQAEVRVQEARAESADRSRRELIVNASHELRTPVASISAHVESLLKPGRRMDRETRDYLKVVASETERLGSLVDDVLILARADADELSLDVRPVEVDKVIARVCDALAPLAKRERSLNLVHSEAAGLPRAMADRERLAQVLTNLVRNAVNHTPDGGIISVNAIAAADRVNIAVSDTGIGIDEEELSKVFERFYRSDQSRARDTGGTGLGLSIVKDLLTAMGGTIDVHSTPGSGSVFTVSLRREAL